MEEKFMLLVLYIYLPYLSTYLILHTGDGASVLGMLAIH
jgi:hypothetical protein